MEAPGERAGVWAPSCGRSRSPAAAPAEGGGSGAVRTAHRGIDMHLSDPSIVPCRPPSPRSRFPRRPLPVESRRPRPKRGWRPAAVCQGLRAAPPSAAVERRSRTSCPRPPAFPEKRRPGLRGQRGARERSAPTVPRSRPLPFRTRFTRLLRHRGPGVAAGARQLLTVGRATCAPARSGQGGDGAKRRGERKAGPPASPRGAGGRGWEAQCGAAAAGGRPMPAIAAGPAAARGWPLASGRAPPTAVAQDAEPSAPNALCPAGSRRPWAAVIARRVPLPTAASPRRAWRRGHAAAGGCSARGSLPRGPIAPQGRGDASAVRGVTRCCATATESAESSAVCAESARCPGWVGVTALSYVLQKQ